MSRQLENLSGFFDACNESHMNQVKLRWQAMVSGECPEFFYFFERLWLEMRHRRLEHYSKSPPPTGVQVSASATRFSPSLGNNDTSLLASPPSTVGSHNNNNSADETLNAAMQCNLKTVEDNDNEMGKQQEEEEIEGNLEEEEEDEKEKAEEEEGRKKKGEEKKKPHSVKSVQAGENEEFEKEDESEQSSEKNEADKDEDIENEDVEENGCRKRKKSEEKHQSEEEEEEETGRRKQQEEDHENEQAEMNENDESDEIQQKKQKSNEQSGMIEEVNDESEKRKAKKVKKTEEAETEVENDNLHVSSQTRKRQREPTLLRLPLNDERGDPHRRTLFELLTQPYVAPERARLNRFEHMRDGTLIGMPPLRLPLENGQCRSEPKLTDPESVRKERALVNFVVMSKLGKQSDLLADLTWEFRRPLLLDLGALLDPARPKGRRATLARGKESSMQAAAKRLGITSGLATLQKLRSVAEMLVACDEFNAVLRDKRIERPSVSSLKNWFTVARFRAIEDQLIAKWKEMPPQPGYAHNEPSPKPNTQ